MKTFHGTEKNKILSLILTFILLLTFQMLRAQTSSRNGYNLPVRGNFKVLMVFVEIDYSSYPTLDPSTSADLAVWQAGQLPTWKDNVFNPTISGTPTAELSRYYYEASFGSYKVTGDYIDKVITISASDIAAFGFSAGSIVTETVNKLNAYGYHPRYGSTFASLDQWIDNDVPGAAKSNASHSPNSFDHVMILMRNYHLFSPSAGYAATWSIGNIWGRSSDSYSHFNARAGVPTSIAYHEFGHLLYGANNFHCVGAGAGDYAFLFRTGGYSGLASSGRMCISANAWDRRRLGWKHSANTYDISARATDGTTEINADFEDDNDLPQSPFGEMILRDFWTYGDAVRIKLPYMQVGTGNANVLDQWLWIENRQMKSGSGFDLNPNAPKGIYAYIQVGKENFADFGGVANYLHFLPALGNYDMEFDPADPTRETVKITAASANPFTGYNNLMQPPFDWDGNDTLSRNDSNANLVHAKKLTINGNPLSPSYYVNPYVMTEGTQYDAFTTSVYNKIGIGHNPAAVPLMTYTSVYNGTPHPSPLSTDNRTIHLNGISIEVLQQYSNGDIRVKVRFDDYKVEGSYRWCGNLMLHKKVEVQPGVTLSIDQGLSSQRPNSPQTINGEKVFADPTYFTMLPLSVFKLEGNSTVQLKGKSTFHIQGGILEIKDGSHFIVEDGSTLILEPDGEIQIKPGGILEVQDGGKLIIRKPKGSGSGNITLGEYRTEAAPPSSSVPAELKMYGDLIFDGVDWEQTQNDGFFSFYYTSTLSLDTGKQVILSSIGENTKLLNLYTTLEIDGNDVNINHAKIKMNSNSNKLLFKNNNVSMDYVQVEGGNIEGDGVNYFDAYQVDVSGADKAFTLRNIGPAAGNIYVRYGTITSSNVGVSIHNVDEIYVSDMDISATTGIFAENSRLVTFKGQINGTYGVDLDEVLGFYATAGVTTITGSYAGIRAENSLVFIRNGATVQNSHHGIEIEGVWDQTGGAFTSMLTVGDVGCGSIILNDGTWAGTGGKGIYGSDAVMNIDATLHALAGGNIQNISPNNIYGNGSLDVCYNDTTHAPDTIPAKGNFWDPTNYTLYTLLKTCNGYCRVGNQAGCSPIILDNSQPSTCDPGTDICSVCGTRKTFYGSAFEQAVFNNFTNYYTTFVETDNYVNRYKFGTIASYDMRKEITSEGTTWKVQVNEDLAEIISIETAHLIQVAKVIYNARGTSSSESILPLSVAENNENSHNSIQLEIEVVPNPAQTEVLININSSNDKNYNLIIYDALGRIALQSSIVNGSNKINLSNIIEPGIYYIKVMSEDKHQTCIKKLIIQR